MKYPDSDDSREARLSWQDCELENDPWQKGRFRPPFLQAHLSRPSSGRDANCAVRIGSKSSQPALRAGSRVAAGYFMLTGIWHNPTM